MALETLIYNALHAGTALHAITGDAIYPKMVPQGAGYPAVSYYLSGGSVENCLQGWGGLQSPRYSVDCWETSYPKVNALSSAVIAAMTDATTFRAVLIAPPVDLSEEDPDTHHQVVDFSVWYNANA